MKGIGKILVPILAVAAVVFTAGAAIPAIGAIVGTGGFGAAIGSVTSALGLGADTLLGSVVTGAITSAGYGALAGGAIAGVTGGDIMEGAESGALAGGLSGGLMGGLNFNPASAASGASGATGTAAADAAVPSTGSNGVAGMPGYGTVTPSPIASSPGAAVTGPASTGAGQAGAAGTAVGAAPAAPVTAAAAPATAGAAAPAAGGGGLLSNLFGNNTDLAGRVIGGIGQGLLSGQDKADEAKALMQRDQASRDATTANYSAPAIATSGPAYGTPGSGSGGLLTPGTQPTGLPSASVAFNPSARWVYDPNQRKLVLVPASQQRA